MLRSNLYEVPVVNEDGKVIGEINFLGIVSHSVWKGSTDGE
jgi:hypothetical protein